MKQNPLLLFRIGYMQAYDGKGEIKHGGAHVDEHGEGGEMWNFREESGRCYGYVMTRDFRGIDLSRVYPSKEWRTNDELENVDVCFISKKDGIGQVVVGWYKNATVFHKNYRKRRGKPSKGDWQSIDYLCEVDATNAILLPEEKRSFVVPTHEKGMPGQSNIWYADSGTNEAKDLIHDIRELMYGKVHDVTPFRAAKRVGREIDTAHILKVEVSAVTETIRYFEGKGYKVTSFEEDNLGWDLEVEKGKEKLCLEVKGHSGNTVQFELTPNEFAKLKEFCALYRVCVVRNALSTPDLKIFSPLYEQEESRWVLVEENGNERISLTEKIAAKAASENIS